MRLVLTSTAIRYSTLSGESLQFNFPVHIGQLISAVNQQEPIQEIIDDRPAVQISDSDSPRPQARVHVTVCAPDADAAEPDTEIELRRTLLLSRSSSVLITFNWQ